MTDAPCAHHFVLDTPTGKPTCSGICRKCGEVRHTFRTSLDDAGVFSVSEKYGASPFYGGFSREQAQSAAAKSHAPRSRRAS